MKQEKTTLQSASQRKTKVIRVATEDYEKINNTAGALVSLFCKRARALGIKVYSRGKNRNLPGQADAIKCLLLPHYEITQQETPSLENSVRYYVEDMIKKAGAV